MSEIRFWKTFLWLCVLALSVFITVRVWNIVIPFILGLAIAYLVYPIVDWLVLFGLRRERVVLVLYTFLLAVFVAIIVTLLPIFVREVDAFTQQLPSYAQTLDQTIHNLTISLRSHLAPIFGKKVQALSIPLNTEKFFENFLQSIPNNLLNIAHGMAWLVIVPFVCFFALSQGKTWINAVFQLTPSTQVENVLGLLAEINAALGGYVRGQMLDALCVGCLTMGGLFMLGIDGAVFLGCLTGVFNLVPFMAPIVGGGLALFVGIMQQQSSMVLLGIVMLYVSIRVFDDFVFIPFVLGHSVQLHPVIMLFAVLAGFELAGLMGLVFAVPVAAIIKVLVSVFLKERHMTSFSESHVHS